MKKSKSNKRYFKEVISISLVLLLTLGIGGTVSLAKLNNNNDNEADNVEDVVGIKFLSKQTNLYGQEDQTFSYSISPSNATNQNVILSLKYKDGTDCSSVMTSSVDLKQKTITLSCKAAFSKQIIATVTSEDNPDAKAEITLDYIKKLLSVSPNYENIHIGGSNNVYASIASTNVDAFSNSLFYSPNYSIYTKDKTYEFTIESLSVTLDELVGGIGWESNENVENTLCNLIEEAILNQKGISDNDLWNLSDNNSWHSWLKASVGIHDQENYVSFEVSYKVYSEGEEQLDNQIYVYLGIAGRNFNDKTVGVDSVIVEKDNIEF